MSEFCNTKHMLSDAMKRLMSERPFNAITVSDICQACRMNRKSFYYHYKDKFDLVNCIYRSEFYDSACEKHYSSVTEFLSDLTQYINNNRAYYRNAIGIRGQNSFRDYFCESLQTIIGGLVRFFPYDPAARQRTTVYLCSMLTDAVERWMCEKEPISAKTFTQTLTTAIGMTTEVRDNFGEYRKNNIPISANA